MISDAMVLKLKDDLRHKIGKYCIRCLIANMDDIDKYRVVPYSEKDKLEPNV